MCNAAVGDISSVLDSHCAQLNSLGFYVTDVAQQPRPRVKKAGAQEGAQGQNGSNLVHRPQGNSTSTVSISSSSPPPIGRSSLISQPQPPPQPTALPLPPTPLPSPRAPVSLSPQVFIDIEHQASASDEHNPHYHRVNSLPLWPPATGVARRQRTSAAIAPNRPYPKPPYRG